MASALKIPRLYTHSPRSFLALSPPQAFFIRPHPSSFPLRRASGSSQKPTLNKKSIPAKSRGAPKKKHKARTTYRQHDVRNAQQFSLVDAMRYIRAFEVGYEPTSPKYELAIRLRSLKNGPAIRNRLQLPHPVNTALRIAVLCPTPSAMADKARMAGAAIVGEDDLIASIKAGEINFDRFLCVRQSAAKLNTAGIGRILGPKGLMPSVKQGTVIDDIVRAVKGLVGGSEYREKLGVIRLAIGQLAFSPEELQQNIKALMTNVNKDAGRMSDKIAKEIHEVVLSSTRAPGFTLTGEFKSANSIPTSDMTRANF